MRSRKKYEGLDWLLRVDGCCEHPSYDEEPSYDEADLKQLVGGDFGIIEFDHYSVVFCKNPPDSKKSVNLQASLVTGHFLVGDVLIVNPINLYL